MSYVGARLGTIAGSAINVPRTWFRPAWALGTRWFRVEESRVRLYADGMHAVEMYVGLGVQRDEGAD